LSHKSRYPVRCRRLAQGGDYLLLAKRNQRTLHAAISDLFSAAPVPWLPEQQARTVEKGHGRLTVRELRVSQELKGYLAPTWPAVAQVFQVTWLSWSGVVAPEFSRRGTKLDNSEALGKSRAGLAPQGGARE
jgi:hypothetical protein